MKTKIIFVNHTSDLVGGAEDDFERLLKYFSQKKEKYSIDGLFPKGPRSFQYSFYCENSFYYRWGIYPVIYRKFTDYIFYLFKLFFQISDLYKAFKNYRYDICLVNVSVLLWPALYFKFRGAKIVFFVRETIYPDISRRIYYRLISKLGNYFFCVSEKLKNDFVLYTGNNNIKTIFSSVENEWISDYQSKLSDDVGEEIFLKITSKESFKFLNIGMITQRKNQILILKALTILLRKENPLKPLVFFIGKLSNERNYVKKFKNYIEENNLNENVVLLGEKERGAYYKIARHMNSFIISSISEGMPLVLVEAFKFKIPLISTNVGGIDEVLINGETGLIVDMNANSLANAMENLMNNPELIKKITSNAYEIHSEKFDLKKNLSIINNVLEKLTG